MHPKTTKNSKFRQATRTITLFAKKLKFQQIFQPTPFPAKFLPKTFSKPKIQRTYAMRPELPKSEI